jgi:prepilin signal peptidase PulO-like enzyme (type II secretory pathway)
LGLLPGILFLLFARISKEAIGYGDGFSICMMGIYLEVETLLSVCMCALFLAGIVALVLLVSGKRKGKQEIPFIPFLLLSFLLEVFWEW